MSDPAARVAELMSRARAGDLPQPERAPSAPRYTLSERVSGLVSVSGYLIGSQEAGKLPLPAEAELQWWYQYYFATARGRAGYDKYRRELAKLIWRTAIA